MRFSTIIAAAALISASATAIAVAQTPSTLKLSVFPNTTLKAADVPAGGYTIDPRHTTVTFRTRHMGVSLFTARIDKVEGKINFDPADPSKSTVEAIAAVGSVSTNVLDAQGQPAFQKEIANSFLGAEANPNATFKSTAIKVTGPTTALIAGDLTLKGVTKPIVLETTFEGGRLPPTGNPPRYRLGFQGQTVIDRTQWGIAAANIDASTSKEVELIINVEALKDVPPGAAPAAPPAAPR